VLLGDKNPNPLTNWGNPICNLLGCNILDFLPRECKNKTVTWTDPIIQGTVVPKSIPQATAYLNPLNARIEGDVTKEFENKSVPGKKSTKVEYKCKEDEPRTTQTIEESAVVDAGSDGDFFDLEALGTGELIDEVVTGITNVAPGSKEKSQEIRFEKSGVLEVIEALFDYWTRGTMSGNIQGTLTLTYEWKGSTQTKDLAVDTIARVPVENLNYAL